MLGRRRLRNAKRPRRVVASAMRIVVAALAFCVMSDSACALMLFGSGTRSCATWLEADQTQNLDFEAWILGHWSGFGMFDVRGGSVGETTDARGILAEVRLTCRERPSISVANAVTLVYLKFQAQHR